MPFTKAYAKILAGMLEGRTLEVFRCIAGKTDKVKAVDGSTLDELVSLELVRRDVTVEENPRMVVVLTSKGQERRRQRENEPQEDWFKSDSLFQ